jgi:DNA-binding GntR family transcriptional regulator
MSEALIITRSLREQVLDHLKGRMSRGDLVPGRFLDLTAIAAEIGISRTPLRDALLRLESEGFVEILPRRGVRVAELTLERIEDIYELLGALESTALRATGRRNPSELVSRMTELNDQMREALAARDFDRFYEGNLAFHDCFLDRSRNEELRRHVRILKQRLYDFPHNRGWIEEWELASIGEHARIVEHLERGEVEAAAEHLRDVHWSFAVQEPFIRKYHRTPEESGDPK